MDKAHLYDHGGALVAVVEVTKPPPQNLLHSGRRFDRCGSEARFAGSECEWVGWDYSEAE